MSLYGFENRSCVQLAYSFERNSYLGGLLALGSRLNGFTFDREVPWRCSFRIEATRSEAGSFQAQCHRSVADPECIAESFHVSVGEFVGGSDEIRDGLRYCLDEVAFGDQERGRESVAEPFYLISVIFVAYSCVSEEKMTIFVKESKDLRPLGWLAIVDANSREIFITKNRKSAQLFGWEFDHVRKNTAFFNSLTPFNAGLCRVSPGTLLRKTNAESCSLSCSDLCRPVVQGGPSYPQFRNNPFRFACDVPKSL